MMTMREARQRLNLVNARIYREGTDFEVVLNEWTRQQRIAGSYSTDDLEDAVFQAQTMRRNATRS